MTTRALIQTASVQLRSLLLRPTHCIALSTHLPNRFCQDDSKLKKKGRPKTEETDTKKKTSLQSSGPAFNLVGMELEKKAQKGTPKKRKKFSALERDIHSLLMEKFQKKQEAELSQERSGLQRRIDLLLTLGCTMTQIQNRVEILSFSEQVILRRATLLKEVGRTPITVSNLLFAKQGNVDNLRKHFELWDSINAAICSILQCSLQELERLKIEHRSLTRFRGVTAGDILARFQVLHSFGVSKEEVRACPEVFNIKAHHLQQKMEKLKQLRDAGKIEFEQYPLILVTQRFRDFDKNLNRVMAQRAELDGSKITLDTIAKRLGVDLKDLEDSTINFYKINPSRCLDKIDFLLAAGISRLDIMSHIYIMKYRLSLIQWSVEKAKSLSTDSPSFYIILSLLRCQRLPKKSFVPARQRIYVSSLLKVPMSEFPARCNEVRPLWSTDRLVIKRNYDFLTSEGFDVENIMSCLILLAHDPESLRHYYASMWSRPEVAAYRNSDVREDKNRTLSLLQYLIEKDMNFTSTVFHADVEYGVHESHDLDKVGKVTGRRRGDNHDDEEEEDEVEEDVLVYEKDSSDKDG